MWSEQGYLAAIEGARKSYFIQMWDVSQFMKVLKKRFTQWFNGSRPVRRKGAVGGSVSQCAGGRWDFWGEPGMVQREAQGRGADVEGAWQGQSAANDAGAGEDSIGPMACPLLV